MEISYCHIAHAKIAMLYSLTRSLDQLLPYYHTAAGLVGGQYQYLGNLHMRRSIGSIHSHICDIVTRQRLDAFIDISSTVVVTMETDVAKICLDKSRLQVCHTDGSICHINAQAISQRLHSGLRRTIYVATSIGCVTSHRAHINDVSTVALYHSWYYETCHRQQSLDVRVNHRFPVIEIALVLRFQPQCQSCIVHQHINLLPLVRQFIDELLSFLAVSHVKGQRYHLRTLGSQFLLNLSQDLLIPSCQNQSVTVLCELLGTSQSYTACRSCYQYDFIHTLYLWFIYRSAADPHSTGRDSRQSLDIGVRGQT